MKYLNKKNIIIWSITIISLFLIVSIIKRKTIIQNAKNSLLIEQVNQIKNRDDLKLIELIKEKKEQKEKTSEILKKSIKDLSEIKKYETCYKLQLNRLIDWKEYWINYCNENLDKFNENLK